MTTFETRIRQTLKPLALAASMTLGAVLSSQAATLSVSPTTSFATKGETVTIQIQGSGFAEALAGGGFDLSYDPTVLQYTGGSIAGIWEFLPALGADTPVSANVSTIVGTGFATFVNNNIGSFAVASFTFTAKEAGTSPLTLSPSAAFDFSNANGDLLTPDLMGGSVVVTSVPEAGSLAMMLAGLLALASLRQRRQP